MIARRGLCIIRVTDADRTTAETDWLVRSESVVRQLRPHIESDYSGLMRRIFASGGRMCVAIEGRDVVGAAIFRVFENTFNRKRFYVDDLIVDEQRRSQGIGHALVAFLEQEAREAGCDSVELDSGTHRLRAHKFYFQEGFLLTSFSFRKEL